MSATLLIADGFEHMLARVVERFQAESPGEEFDVLCTSTFRDGEAHNVTDVEDEAQDLRSALQRLIVVRKRGGIVRSVFHARRQLGRYRTVNLSAEGDRQWVILFGCWLAGAVGFGTAFRVLEPRSQQIRRASAWAIMRRMIAVGCSRRMMNLAVARLSLILRLKRVVGYPDSIIIEPVGACNLHCRSCITGVGQLQRQARRLTVEQFCSVMDQLGPYLRWLDISGYGEPLLHPKIVEMIAYAKTKRIPTVQLDTNANVPWTTEQLRALVRSGIDNIIISLDGLTQEVYVTNRVGGDIEKVKQFVQRLIEAKRLEGSLKPVVVVQMILMKQNEHQIEEFKRAARAMGADNYRLKHFWLNRSFETEELKRLLPETEEHRDFVVDGERIINKRPPNINYCRLLWDEMFVASDGTVMPCCFDPNATLNMGNLFEAKDAKVIWNGPRYRRLRRQMVTDKSQIDTCRTCIMWTAPNGRQ